jgi:hypothetical protein
MINSSVINYDAPKTITDFMLDDSKVRLIIGPYGSGKTTGCIMELMRRAMMEHPDTNGVRKTRFVIVRNTSQQLRQTILEDIRKWLTPAMTYRVTDSTVQFRFSHPTLGRIESDWLMIPLDQPEDQQRLLSLNITGGWVSEFREIPIRIVEALLGRCGRYKPLGVTQNAWYGVIAESNPPDEDSDWYKKLEIERPPTWKLFKQPGGMSPHAENKEPGRLPPSYYEDLIASNNPDWVDIHVHAKYGKSLSGQAVFRASFKADFHVTYNSLKPIPSLPLMIGQDFGRTPAALIAQVDNRGRLVVFKEATSVDMGVEQFATSILRPLMFRDFIGLSSFMVADPTGKDKGQVSEESPFDALKRIGFKVYGAPTNDIDPRVRAVEQLFLRQIDGGPMLIIDGGGCPQLVQTLKYGYRYRRKQNGELEDKPEKTHPWSDLADCLQYLALSTNANYTGRVMAESRPRVRRPAPPASAWT